MSLNEITAILKLADPFQTLDDEQLKLIGFVSDARSLAANEVLFSEGAIADGAYILVSGALQSTHEGATTEGPILRDKGTTFGELALIVDKPRPATVTALSDSELVFVPRKHFKRLMENYPELAAKVAARIKMSISRYVHALGAADVH